MPSAERTVIAEVPKTAPLLLPVGRAETLPGLPEIYVHEASRTISIDGGIIKFRTGKTRGNSSYWNILFYFLKHPNTDIDNSTLKEISGENGTNTKNLNIATRIFDLRKRIEKDSSNPKILTTVVDPSNRAGTQKYSYRLNAIVHIVDKLSTPETIEKKEPKSGRHWEPKREKAAYALFALTDDRNSFKYNSRPEIVRKVYEDSLNLLSGTPEYNQEYGKCYLGFTSVREGVIITLKKLAANPNNRKLPPEALDFWNWLRTQPKYVNATIDDLILVVKRTKTRTGLQNKTFSPASLRQRPSAESTSVEKEGKEVPSRDDQAASRVRITSSTFSDESTSEKPEYPQWEKAVGGKYELKYRVIGDLGRVLKESSNWSILKKFGIELSQDQVKQIRGLMPYFCDEKLKEFESSTDTIEVFKTLKSSVRDLTGEHRKDFKKQNPDLIGPMLEIFDTVTSIEDFDSLMLKLCNAYLSRKDKNISPFTSWEEIDKPNGFLGQKGEFEIEDFGPEKSVDYEKN